MALQWRMKELGKVALAFEQQNRIVLQKYRTLHALKPKTREIIDIPNELSSLVNTIIANHASYRGNPTSYKLLGSPGSSIRRYRGDT